jgi:hypothetical protein
MPALPLSGAGLTLSARALADAIGASPTRANTSLRALADAGKVRVVAGSAGTYVEIL